jgi:hypothetical protein
MLTRDLIRDLCTKLDHEDAAAAIVKKVVSENMLNKVDDLRYVPRSRLENWEVPLKLVDAMFDSAIDVEVDDIASGVSDWVNYSLPTAMDQYVKGPISTAFKKLRDDSEKRQNITEWAAKKLQRAYRRYKYRKDQMREDAIMSKAMKELDTQNDFRRLNDKDNEARRRKRAEARIKIAVRRWRERRKVNGRAPKGADQSVAARASLVSNRRFSASASLAFQSGLAISLVRLSGGKVRDCQVSKLLHNICRALRQDGEDSLPFFHKLVTQNWIEELDDLALVEDPHWEAWGFPEKMVILLKQELYEHQERKRPKIAEVAQGVAVSVGNAACGAWNAVSGLAVSVSSSMFGDEAEEGHQSDQSLGTPPGSTQRPKFRGDQEAAPRTRRL